MLRLETQLNRPWYQGKTPKPQRNTGLAKHNRFNWHDSKGLCLSSIHQNFVGRFDYNLPY